MLFDPCGDLLKDYGAYCETLRITEREDVYSAICAHEMPAPRPPAADTIDHAVVSNTSSTPGGEEDGGRGKATRASSQISAKKKNGASRKASQAKTGVDASDGVTEATAAGLVTAASIEASLLTLTTVKMHYPIFCLNQRDITPLCRAIPYCPSLVSVELVGCGLSVQSYKRLVEAVYRAPRVVSVAVDFNTVMEGRHRPMEKGIGGLERGFVRDPTLYQAMVIPAIVDVSASAAGEVRDAASEAGKSSSKALAQAESYDAAVLQLDTNAAVGTAAAAVKAKRGPAHRGTAPGGGGGDADKLAGSSRRSHSSDNSSDEESLRPAGDEGGTANLFLYPTQYCGLDQLLPQPDQQATEEKDKKGKPDAKRAQQVQAQREALREFDQSHKLAVPHSWEGVLYTGLHHLSLRGNRLDDAAVGRLAAVLLSSTHSRLLSLNLWGNEITDVGAGHLATVLRRNQNLRVLDLGHNRLGDEGILELVRCCLMREVNTQEEVTAARQAYLTRRDASAEERATAGQPLLIAEIPSYEDLYGYWWYKQQVSPLPPKANSGEQIPMREREETATAGAGARGGGGEEAQPAADKNAAAAATPAVSVFLPPPPVRELVPSSGGPGGSKRTTPAKNKVAKADGGAGASPSNPSSAPALTTSAARAQNRPTGPFDCACVRVYHCADSDTTLRIPGNTVLEVLQLEENSGVTLEGVQEIARLLGLREPSDTTGMVNMVTVTDPLKAESPPVSPSNAAATVAPATFAIEASGRRTPSTPQRTTSASGAQPAGSVTSIRAPELHCAGLRLRMCMARAHREAHRATWPEMEAAQDALTAAVESWTGGTAS